jgi:hypothetical protein
MRNVRLGFVGHYLLSEEQEKSVAFFPFGKLSIPEIIREASLSVQKHYSFLVSRKD